MHYTSCTFIKAQQKCPRSRYLLQLYKGKGIVPTYASIPLTTGTCVHAGIEFLMKSIKNGLIIQPVKLDNFIDGAVQIATEGYIKIVKESGIKVSIDEDYKFIYNQELARTEALVRAWGIAELPMILKYYTVYSSEQEISVPFGDDITFMAKVDAVLRSKEHGIFSNYSLKTMATYRGELTDRSFANALQTYTETWAMETYLKQNYRVIRRV